MLISDCYLGFEKEYCIEEIVKSQEMETGIWTEDIMGPITAEIVNIFWSSQSANIGKQITILAFKMHNYLYLAESAF